VRPRDTRNASSSGVGRTISFFLIKTTSHLLFTHAPSTSPTMSTDVEHTGKRHGVADAALASTLRADLTYLNAESHTIWVEQALRRILTTLPSGKPCSSKTKIGSPFPTGRRASISNASAHPPNGQETAVGRPRSAGLRFQLGRVMDET